MPLPFRQEARDASSDGDYALQFMLDYFREETDVPEAEWPALLTISHWYYLDQLHHSCPGGADFIFQADLAKDCRFPSDGPWSNKCVMGFNDDDTGRKALHMIFGWMNVFQTYPVWQRGEDGKYHAIDIGPNPYEVYLGDAGFLSPVTTEYFAALDKRKEGQPLIRPDEAYFAALPKEMLRPKEEKPVDRGLDFLY